MRLTRRDALAALAAAGASGGAVLALEADREPTEGPLDRELPTMVAVAEVLYPSEIEGVEAFVRRFLEGRAMTRPRHTGHIIDAADFLDDYALAWYDRPFAVLPPPTRDDALRRMGTDSADPDPDGSDVERVRHYVVDELLFAFYASPTGGELVGLENPPGHPGGLDSYQRGQPP